MIPWSDSAAQCIDINLDKLKDKFIVPSIQNTQGAIGVLMNKYSQIKFAEKYNIPVAKTWICDFENSDTLNEVSFPCIIKPVASYEGNKQDIEKCVILEELNALLLLKYDIPSLIQC